MILFVHAIFYKYACSIGKQNLQKPEFGKVNLRLSGHLSINVTLTGYHRWLSYTSLILHMYELWIILLWFQMCQNGDLAASKFHCHGICSLLKTCQSCLSQGQGVKLTSSSPRRRFYQDECSWCVKNSTCQRKSGIVL